MQLKKQKIHYFIGSLRDIIIIIIIIIIMQLKNQKIKTKPNKSNNTQISYEINYVARLISYATIIV